MIIKNLLNKQQSIYFKEIEYILFNLPELYNESHYYNLLRTRSTKKIDVIAGIHTTDSLITINNIVQPDNWHFNIKLNNAVLHVYVLPYVYPNEYNEPVTGWQLDPYRNITF